MAEINGRKIPKDRELIFKNVSTRDQRKGHYVPDIVKHPAKMQTYLADWIILNFSEIGDTILDPIH